MRTKNVGFTLIEIMVALVLAAILLGIATPSFSEFVRNARIASAANGVLAAMHAARTEAIKRRAPVTVCASGNPTSDSPTCDADGDFSGWLLFVDDDGDPDPLASTGKEGNGSFEPDKGEILLRTSGRPQEGLDVLPSTVYVQFGANGFQRRDMDAAPDDVDILICDSRGSRSIGSSGTAARLLQVTRTGRPQITRDETAVKAAIATLGKCPADS
jgi:type IV fimbrial biogenesis protein FimT